jgi:hypothetical protein
MIIIQIIIIIIQTIINIKIIIIIIIQTIIIIRIIIIFINKLLNTSSHRI